MAHEKALRCQTQRCGSRSFHSRLAYRFQKAFNHSRCAARPNVLPNHRERREYDDQLSDTSTDFHHRFPGIALLGVAATTNSPRLHSHEWMCAAFARPTSELHLA